MTRLFILAALALLGALSTLTALFTLSGASAPCAPLGAIPTCEVLLFGYCALFASTLITGRTALFTFLPGWMVTLSVSLTGSLEGVFAFHSVATSPLISFASLAISLALATVWVRPYWLKIKRSRPW